MHQVEKYWKVQVVSLLIIGVFFAVAFFTQSNNTEQDLIAYPPNIQGQVGN